MYNSERTSYECGCGKKWTCRRRAGAMKCRQCLQFVHPNGNGNNVTVNTRVFTNSTFDRTKVRTPGEGSDGEINIPPGGQPEYSNTDPHKNSEVRHKVEGEEKQQPSSEPSSEAEEVRRAWKLLELERKKLEEDRIEFDEQKLKLCADRKKLEQERAEFVEEKLRLNTERKKIEKEREVFNEELLKLHAEIKILKTATEVTVNEKVGCGKCHTNGCADDQGCEEKEEGEDGAKSESMHANDAECHSGLNCERRYPEGMARSPACEVNEIKEPVWKKKQRNKRMAREPKMTEETAETSIRQTKDITRADEQQPKGNGLDEADMNASGRHVTKPAEGAEERNLPDKPNQIHTNVEESNPPAHSRPAPRVSNRTPVHRGPATSVSPKPPVHSATAASETAVHSGSAATVSSKTPAQCGRPAPNVSPKKRPYDSRRPSPSVSPKTPARSGPAPNDSQKTPAQSVPEPTSSQKTAPQTPATTQAYDEMRKANVKARDGNKKGEEAGKKVAGERRSETFQCKSNDAQKSQSQKLSGDSHGRHKEDAFGNTRRDNRNQAQQDKCDSKRSEEMATKAPKNQRKWQAKRGNIKGKKVSEHNNDGHNPQTNDETRNGEDRTASELDDKQEEKRKATEEVPEGKTVDSDATMPRNIHTNTSSQEKVKAHSLGESTKHNASPVSGGRGENIPSERGFRGVRIKLPEWKEKKNDEPKSRARTVIEDNEVNNRQEKQQDGKEEKTTEEMNRKEVEDIDAEGERLGAPKPESGSKDPEGTQKVEHDSHEGLEEVHDGPMSSGREKDNEDLAESDSEVESTEASVTEDRNVPKLNKKQRYKRNKQQAKQEKRMGAGKKKAEEEKKEEEGGHMKQETVHEKTEEVDEQQTEENKLEKLRKEEEAEERKMQGNQKFNDGLYAEAVVHYTAAIELAPKATYYSNRCIAQMKMDKIQEALDDARISIDLDGTAIKARSNHIKCLVLLGEAKLAEQYGKELLRMEPEDSNAKSFIQKAARIKALSTELAKNMKNEAFESARKKVDELLRIATHCRRFMHKRAEILVRLRRYDDAETALRTMGQNSTDPEVTYIQGLCDYHQDKLDNAKRQFKATLALDPGHHGASEIYRLTVSLYDKKETCRLHETNESYKKAYQSYTSALTVDPKNHMTNINLYKNRAECSKKLNRMDDAISDYSEMIKRKYTPAYVERARCYMTKGRYELAKTDLENAMKTDTSDEVKELLAEVTRKTWKPKPEPRRPTTRPAVEQKSKDFYDVLGVSKTASQTEIKRNYLELAKLHHPDKHSAASSEKKSQEEEKFKLISEAYNTLSDSTRRREYDRRDDPVLRRHPGFDPFEAAFFRHFIFRQFFAPRRNVFYDDGTYFVYDDSSDDEW